MNHISFTEEEKVRIFDRIAREFYNANFGHMSKSDIELLMFHFYIEKIMKGGRKDGLTDYNRCSDYKISRDLGITQRRVRNFKVRNRLVYPRENSRDSDWQKDFANLVKNARYEQSKIYVNIPDPNLFYEIENFIEENGAYIEKQLNSKLLVMRVEYFIELVVSLESDENKEKIRKEIISGIKKQNKDAAKIENSLNNISLGKELIETGVGVIDLLNSVSALFSPGNLLFAALKGLIGIA